MDAKAISRVEAHLRSTFSNSSLAVKARKQNDSAEERGDQRHDVESPTGDWGASNEGRDQEASQ